MKMVRYYYNEDREQSYGLVLDLEEYNKKSNFLDTFLNTLLNKKLQL